MTELEKSVLDTATLLAALKAANDPWNPGSAVRKAAEMLAGRLERLCGELLKAPGQ